MGLTVMQLLPALDVGGVERGTIEIARALVANGHRAIVVSAGGRLKDELKRIGATHLELTIGAKRLNTLFLVKALRAAIRAEAVDVVHARSRLPAWIGRFALRGIDARERPAWVTTVHGPYTVNAYSRIMTSGERIIAISAFIRDYILDNYPAVDAAAIHVIPRGIDREQYPPRYVAPATWTTTWNARFQALAGRRLLVAPGRLTRWKGQEDFIALIAELIARGAPVHGLIAGGADRRSQAFERELHERVRCLGVQQHITFLGHRTDLREVLAHADIAYSLTLEPEAFGRTTVEALSVGTPVIGYRHGGTAEILAELLPAGLVAYRDIRAAADATQRCLAQSFDVPAIHRFTLDRMCSDTLALYRELRGG